MSLGGRSIAIGYFVASDYLVTHWLNTGFQPEEVVPTHDANLCAAF
jgi:hypothetical protein